uniref:Aquaporin n=1 Tax=Rhabditophanes sp. KR3021 TaxID=114890 RepID=A0AC35U6D5_9BILA
MTFNYVPATVAIVFYIACFTLGEICRTITTRIFKQGTLPYIFLIEAIGTLQMCTCVYENGIMVKYYGPMGFFFTVTVLLAMASTYNRGSFGSPLAPIEMYCFNVIPLPKLLTVLFGQVLGGAYAFVCAKLLWYYTQHLANEHSFQFKYAHKCVMNYKVDFIYVLLFEFVGCFVLRFLISKMSEKVKFYAIPVLVSSLLTSGIIFVGVGGLNPTVAASRLYGCLPVDKVWFVITYWITPVLGWLSAAYLIHNSTLKKVAPVVEKKDSVKEKKHTKKNNSAKKNN